MSVAARYSATQMDEDELMSPMIPLTTTSTLTGAPLLLSAVALLAAGCGGSAQTMKGTVVDIWGDPVQGAMVKLEGLPDRPVTDRDGRFSLPFKPGTHTLKAGLEGYIQQDVELIVPEDYASVKEPVLELYPIPEEKGFHVIGSDRYIKLPAKPIRALGNNLKSLYGLQEPGNVSVDGSQLRFIYHGDLRQDQLMALDVSLHQLQFVKTAELVGVTTTEVPLNLHTSAKEVELTIERLKSRNDYLLKSSGELSRRTVYALTTNDLLTPPDDESFRQIAPSLRVAFPVELR